MQRLSSRRAMLRSVAASLLLLILAARQTSAASIDLSNDVNVSWSNNLDCNSNPEEVANFPEIVCAIPVVGAPRLVPDARNVTTLLTIEVDIFESVGGFAELFLNVGDSNLNAIILPGSSDPLTLTKTIQFGPNDLLNFTLADFTGSDALPAGDLVFSVGGFFSVSELDSTGDPAGNFDSNRTKPAAQITLAGPGTVLAVPEPNVSSLLLFGLCATALLRRRFANTRLFQA